MSDQEAAKERGGVRRVRWKLLSWPAAVVLLIAIVALIRVWSMEVSQRQESVQYTILIGLGVTVLLGLWFLIWLLFLSRLPLRLRLAGLGLCVGALLFLGFSLEMKGLTGDAMPILGWKWTGRAGEAALAAPAATTARAPAPAIRSESDYPQFLGPRRDGSVTEVRLAREWTEPPVALWRREVGAGWSGFAVSGGYAVTQEQHGPQETVTCYDLETGELRWAHADEARWDDPLGGPGPRATPTIHDGKVYALGGTGLLNALDLVSGERIWSRNIVEENGAETPTYGVSASPLVVDDAVVVVAGGPRGKSLVAYDRATGALLWSGGDDGAAYSSPIVAQLAGRRTIAFLGAANVIGHDATDGEPLWSYPWPPTERVSQVLVLPGERLFLSSGYGVGAKLLGLEEGSDGDVEVGQVWESQAMKAKFTNVVFRDGHLYGLDDGILACIDASTGERRWKGGRYGHGQVILVHDLLLVLGEKGRVLLVEAVPDAHRELASFAALSGKTWNHPALAGRHLIVRNDREAACFALPLAGAAGS